MKIDTIPRTMNNFFIIFFLINLLLMKIYGKNIKAKGNIGVMYLLNDGAMDVGNEKDIMML